MSYVRPSVFGVPRAGQALLLCLLLLLFVAGLSAVVVKVAREHVSFTTTMRDRAQSRLLCEAGIEYALLQLDRGEWLGKLQKANRITHLGAVPAGRSDKGSPSRGRFEVVVERCRREEPAAPAEDKLLAEMPPPLLRITATGIVDGQQCTRTTYASDPTDLWSCALNVYQVDWGQPAHRRAAVTSVGDTGTESLVQELRTIPGSGRLALGARSDPIFAGIDPGTVSVLCREAEGLRALWRAEAQVEDREPGRYRLDGAAGVLDFAPGERGKTVVIRYDYLRRVPKSPGPFVFVVPYTPMVPNTEALWDAAGRRLRRDAVRPRLQGHYGLDEERGEFFFTEHDTWIPVRTPYAFQGTRFTGPVRVNGDLEWSGRNLLYLCAAENETVAVTGTHRYRPGAQVFVTHEEGQTIAAADRPSAHVLEGAPWHWPPPLSLAFYRELTDRRLGGDGLYLNNPGHRQDPAEAVREWARESSRNWRGGVYSPPGAELDLATMELPANGVVFAEGNVNVRGIPAAGTRLTIVSGGTIYVESSVGPPVPVAGQAEGGSLALIAAQHVCVNTTQFPSRAAGGVEAHLHALVWARGGTFGAVAAPTGPGQHGQRNRLLVRGSVSVNIAYPADRWARAFTSVEFMHDWSLRSPTRRPPWLVCEATGGTGR
jgi:hypothetical protein